MLQKCGSIGITCLALGAEVFLPQPVFGQVAAEESGLQEVVVTAQKHQENAQNVPIAISVVTANDLQSHGVRGTDDLPVAVPGLNFSSVSVFAAQPFLRGVGTNNPALGDESAVAIYVDGVYYAAPSGLIFGLNNISQIEVDKGPQGTLFGRNATGGVIQITTREPQERRQVDFTVGGGNYDTINSSFYATGGLTSKLVADLSVYVNDQRSGWGRNLTTGQDVHLGQEYAARSKWRLNIDELTTIKLVVDYDHTITDLNAAYVWDPPSPAPGTPYPGFYNVTSDIKNTANLQAGGAALTAEHEFSWATLSSVTALRRVELLSHIDQDPTGRRGAALLVPGSERTWTEELQLKSVDRSPIKWVAGFFYFSDRTGTKNNGFQILDTPLPTPEGLLLRLDDAQASASYAAFAQATATILPDTRLTLGGRYTVDHRSVFFDEHTFHVATRTFSENVGNPARGKASFDKPTWRVALDHDFTHSILGYVSYNRGFKSGLYNLLNPFASGAPEQSSAYLRAVRPEVLDAYELGVKTELFQRRVRANASAFYYDFRDLQTNRTVAGGSLLLNAANSTIEGLDLDIEAQVLPHLRVVAAANALHAYFTSFPGAPRTGPGPAGGLVNLPALDAEGKYLPQAPKLTGSLLAQYTVPTHFGDLVGEGSFYYNDGFFWSAENRLAQKAYHTVNAALTWNAPSAVWDVRLWGKNIFGEKHFTYNASVVPFGDRGSPAAPATYGIDVGYHFY